MRRSCWVCVTGGFRAIFLDQFVVPSACSKHLFLLRIEKTLEENATRVELLVEAAQHADVDFALHTPQLRVIDNRTQMCKDDVRSFKVLGALE